MRRLALALLLVSGCAGDDDAAAPGAADLPLGDLSADDAKDDGYWGAALACKPIPDLPPLVDPEITISLDGLTLHLVDRAGGYDRVFPVGVGTIENGESHSYWPIKAYRRNDFVMRPATNVPCKIWWTDPDTGKTLPVFAGLPYLSWSGSYAVHGPIDNFRAPNGGNLRRGYVSHGCIRMEAADVLEVYARIRSAAQVPVHVQREPERLASGTRADVTPRWMGAECASDSDCAFNGGFCHHNPWSGRGFCSARCTSSSPYCADRAGYPQTFCVADPDDGARGMCVPKAQLENWGCRPYDHFQPMRAERFTQSWVGANVCLPGSGGWIGDHCFTGADCDSGVSCAGATAEAPGLCTMACTRVCPDQPGYATTFCADTGSAGTCLRSCTPSENAPECASGTSCEVRTRRGDPTVSRAVCVAD